MEFFLVALIVNGICAVLSYKIAGTQLAAVVGFLLGPIGVLISCFIKKGES